MLRGISSCTAPGRLSNTGATSFSSTGANVTTGLVAGTSGSVSPGRRFKFESAAGAEIVRHVRTVSRQGIFFMDQLGCTKRERQRDGVNFPRADKIEFAFADFCGLLKKRCAQNPFCFQFVPRRSGADSGRGDADLDRWRVGDGRLCEV